MTPEIDKPSGQETTGHEWNGIKELNTPVPRAMRVWLWASIAVCVPFWVLYPSFPTVKGYAAGLLGYASRDAVTQAVAEGAEHRAGSFAPFETADVAELALDPSLRVNYEDAIAVLYRDNCSVCHGRDLTGQPSFPNLTDDHWLWSGLPEEIEYTLQVGINANNDDTRYAEMPAFGRDGLLEPADLTMVTEHVRAISGQDHDAASAEAGAIVFEENCAGCHGEAGEGGLQTGAPALNDATWLYGGSRDTILETLKYGRAGVMPAWSGRLSEADIRKLALYVYWQGQSDDQR